MNNGFRNIAENSSLPPKEFEQVENVGDNDSALGNDKTVVSTKLSTFLVHISELFPNLVSVGTEERARNFGDSTVSPKIILDFKINKSWLIPPKPEIKSDTIGVWPSNTNYPTADKYLMPPKMQNDMPYKLPMLFHDTDMELFLTGNSLCSNSKVKLHSLAFEPSETSLEKGSNFPAIDSLSRKGLIENALVDQWLESGISHTNTLLSDWEEHILNLPLLKEHLSLHSQAMHVAWSANLRCKNFLIALFTNNKICFRQHILDKCTGSTTTKDILKGTALATPFLFGDIPESFAKKLEVSSNVHNSYVLRPKGGFSKGASSYSGSKRQSNFSFNSEPKRYKPNFSGFNSKFKNNNTNKYDSNNNSQQFFRGKKQQNPPHKRYAKGNGK